MINIANIIIPLQAETALNWIERALQHPAGSATFILLLFGGSIFMVYVITKFISTHKITSKNDRDRVCGVETRLEKIEDKHNNHLDAIRKDIAIIKGSISLLKGKETPLTATHSPISLTSKGKEIAADMGLNDIISSNWDKIFCLLEENLESKNAYDIQKYCIETASVSLDKFFKTEDIDKIKNFAYKNGQPLIYYGSMIGVMIRDDYFRHKGINPLDVDKHDPNIKP